MYTNTMSAFVDELCKIADSCAPYRFHVGVPIGKTAALATDLRMKGLGGVKRPPEPTEDSKGQAFSLLKNSQKPGSFTNMATPKTLIKPGPSISQVATNPVGVA
jgi:hypothetical protein